LTLKKATLSRMPCYHLSLRQRNLDGQIENDVAGNVAHAPHSLFHCPSFLPLISLPQGNRRSDLRTLLAHQHTLRSCFFGHILRLLAERSARPATGERSHLMLPRLLPSTRYLHHGLYLPMTCTTSCPRPSAVRAWRVAIHGWVSGGQLDQ